jgi:MoaA/NifB/PqqE/SkfB family radical SAM enzyme
MERAEEFLTTASRMIVSGLGEPTASPAFWWLLEHTKERGDLFIRVNSNGHFLTSEKALKISKSRLSEISFSLDSATPETYAKIRGGDFKRALKGISTMLGTRAETQNKHLEIFINMTLMKENLSEAESFVALGKTLGADGVIFSQLFGFGDRPEWKVERGQWTFVYSEQLISLMPGDARHHISQAKECSEALEIPVRFESNVLNYLN